MQYSVKLPGGPRTVEDPCSEDSHSSACRKSTGVAEFESESSRDRRTRDGAGVSSDAGWKFC